MADPRFLLKTDLSTATPVMFGDQPLFAHYPLLVAELRGRGQATAAALFAEPVSGSGAVSWYAEATGEPRAMRTLSAARQSEVEDRLRGLLLALDPLFDQPLVGPLLKRALVLPDADAILSLDDAVVLAGWGFVPPGQADDAALATQLRTVLGRYSPRLAAADAAFLSASGPPPRPELVAPAPARNAPPPAAPVRPVLPPPSPPAAAAARPWWMVPLVAAVAIIFLGLGFWLAWRGFGHDMAGRQITTAAVDEGAMRAAIRMQRETNQALELELERLRRVALQPNVCTPESPLGLRPPVDRQPARPDAVPPPVPRQQGEAAQPFTGSLAQLLEHSTVMIVTAGPDGIGHGSGFFIAGDLVMTNAHVVQHAAPDQIYIMSATIGRSLPAKLMAITRGDGGGDVAPGQTDFALLRLAQPVPGAQPLAFTPVIEKLTEVVAAGYPASVIRLEEGMRELAEGRLGTPPELVLNRGSISTIQRLDNGVSVMAHTADISPGNSGGPLIDTCGRVVGINTFVTKSTSVADRGKYAQKAENAIAWLQQQNVTPQVKTEPCQPAQPTLPALPPQAQSQPQPGPSAGTSPGGSTAPPASEAKPPAASAAPPR